MNKILKLSLLSLFAIPVLAGCDNGKKKEKPDEIIAAESETAFKSIGVAYSAFSNSNGLGLAGAYLSKECITPNGFKFEYTYTVTSTSSEYMYDYVKLQSDGLTLEVMIPEIWELPIENQMYAVYVLNAKSKFVGYTKDDADYSSFVGQETGTKDWKIRVNSMEERPVIEKISVAKTAHSDDDTVIVRGYVSGYFQKKDGDFHTGVFLSDGPDTVMLYAGSISNNMDKLEIGNLVQVIAIYSAYNGLIEFKPESNGIALLKSDETIAAPVVVDYTPAQFVALKGASSGNICRVEGLTIASTLDEINALDASGGKHWTIKAEAGGKDINIYVNYHIGSEAQTEIKNLLVANYSKSFTFVGTVGYYNTPQLSPLISFATETAAQCFQFAA